jgi:hypothetical protein
MSLLGFLLPRYGLKMIIRNRASIQGPLPVFCAGLGALALAAISLRMGVAQPAAEERWTPSPPPRQPVKVAQMPDPEKAPSSPPASPRQDGQTPASTEAIESLAVLKRGMKVWAPFGRWQQGTVVGRGLTGWVVVRLSEGLPQGPEIPFPLDQLRIEASELNREDLRDVPPIADTPGEVPREIREFRERVQRAREKAGQGGEKP